MPSEDPDFDPLFVRSEEEIRAAINAYVNQGIDPTDDRYVDTREGSMFWIITQPLVIEIARLWDALGTETAAAAYVQTAWGDKLDLAAGEYGIERKAATKAVGVVEFEVGDTDVLIGQGFTVSVVQTDPDIDPPEYVTTESATIPATTTVAVAVEAADEGVAGNVAAGAVTVPVDSAPGLVSVTNPDPIVGGSDVEDDIELRLRTLTELISGKGSGTMADYVRWGLAHPGVGRVTVIPIWNGPGTVLVIIADVNGQPVPGTVITELQTELDPVAGQGKGLAPINHEVTVVTPTGVAINVTATITPVVGYTVTGLQATAEEALASYINSLQPGDDVVYEHAKAMLFDVEGVYDVTAFSLNGGAVGAGVTINTSPPQIAQMGTVVLS